MGISKVLELLAKVLEENRSIKTEITNLRSEVRALRREMVRPVAPEASPSSIKLPLRTMEEFKHAEAVMRETPYEKQKMVGTNLHYPKTSQSMCKLIQSYLFFPAIHYITQYL